MIIDIVDFMARINDELYLGDSATKLKDLDLFKNLVNINNVDKAPFGYSVSGNSIIVNFESGKSGYVKFHTIDNENNIYTISFDSSSLQRILLFPLNSSGELITNLSIENFAYNSYYAGYFADVTTDKKSITVNLNNSVSKFAIGLAATIEPSQTYSNVQVEKGELASNYMPYSAYIVESGSNENGSWVKWSDGTMICTCFDTKTVANQEITTITFPATFINNKMAVITNTLYNYHTGATITIANRTTKTFSAYPKFNNAIPNVAEVFMYIAIGKWK